MELPEVLQKSVETASQHALLCALSFFILVILVICIISWRKDLDRTNRMARIARQLGLGFQSRAGFSVLGFKVPFAGGVSPGLELSPFRLCPCDETRPSSSTGIRNMMHGQVEGNSLWLFDHFSGHGAGKGSRTYWSLVCYFRSQQLSLPRFSVRARCRWAKGGILIQSDPTFSGKYVLEGDDSDVLLQLFDETKRAFFVTHADLNVEGDGGRLVVYRISGGNTWRRADAEMIFRLLDEALEVLSLFQSG